MLQSFNPLTLAVSDLQKSLSFWRQLPGLSVLQRRFTLTQN